MNLLKIWLIICISLPALAQQSTVDLVRNDLAAGRLDSISAYQILQTWSSGESVQMEYRSETPVKCGTFIRADVGDFAKRHAQIWKTSKVASQTFHEHTFTGSKGTRTFRIHFDTTGANEVPLADLNSNGIRDWVEETGKAFEKSYRLQVDTLGYKEPLNFTNSPFYYPVYIEDLNSDYGYTEGLSLVTSNPNTWTTAIYIENDYTEGGYATHGYDALRVTCAHEFLHAIQFSYIFRDTDVWYYETSSTWMEDVAYDEVNDYYAYIPTLFNSPQSSMTSFSTAYAMCVWNHVIEKKYGRGVIRKSWENMPTMTALPAINSAIEDASNSNLALNFADFTIWNAFTADRADSVNYYPEGSAYPKIRPLFASGLRDTVIQKTLGNLASHYVHVWVIDTLTCSINLTKFESSSQFSLSTIEFNAASGKRFVQNHGSATTIMLDGLLPGDSLMIIIANTNVSALAATNTYSLSVSRTSTPIDGSFSDFYMYPSPFKPDEGLLKLKFRLRKTSSLKLDIFNLRGRKIRSINMGTLSPGAYDGASIASLTWDGKTSDNQAASSGVYFYVLEGSGFKKTGKIALVR